MKRSKINALLHAFYYRIGNYNAFAELVAPMHQAVTHGIDFAEALDTAILTTGNRFEDKVDSHRVLGHIFLKHHLLSRRQFEL